MRAPSIFHSKATSPASVSSASSVSFAVCASIGSTGTMTCELESCESRGAGFTRGARDGAEIAFVHRRAADFGERYARLPSRSRRSSRRRAHPDAGRPRAAAAGIAAPVAVARPNKLRKVFARCAPEPLPPIAANSPNTRSTSMRSRRGCGGGRLRADSAAPKGQCRCGPGGFRRTGRGRRFPVAPAAARAGARRAVASSRTGPRFLPPERRSRRCPRAGSWFREPTGRYPSRTG